MIDFNIKLVIDGMVGDGAVARANLSIRQQHGGPLPYVGLCWGACPCKVCNSAYPMSRAWVMARDDSQFDGMDGPARELIQQLLPDACNLAADEPKYQGDGVDNSDGDGSGDE